MVNLTLLVYATEQCMLQYAANNIQYHHQFEKYGAKQDSYVAMRMMLEQPMDAMCDSEHRAVSPRANLCWDLDVGHTRTAILPNE